LIIAGVLGKQGAETFRIGYVAGLAHYLSMLYWLLLIPYRWHGLPLAPALGWIALSAFLSLYTGTWVWMVARMRGLEIKVQKPEAKEHGSTVNESNNQEPGASLQSTRAGLVCNDDERLTGILPRSWSGRTLWTLSCAAAWVALEMFIARVFGGFPWDLLGVSQYRMVPLIQMASVTGVYGISFLVVWLSLSLLSAGLMMIRRPTTRSIWLGEICLPILVVAILFNLGFHRLNHVEPRGRTIRVTLVQPSIPQTLIWDASKSADRFRELLQLSEQALTNQTDLMIWPESAVPKLLRYDQETFEATTALARRHHIWLIVGSDDAEPRRAAKNPDDADYFNSSFLISPEGKLVERYVKRNLVIFGEYLPLQSWLPFLKYFTPIEGGFTPGTHAARFELTDLRVQTPILICFEDTFPHLARKDVRPETSFLVNITNDGWFDESAAQWQQALTAVFRTVENGVPLVRCANNGLTCWIDVQGRLRDVFHDGRGSVYGSGYLLAEIPIPAPGQSHELTFYTRHGDWFGWGCVAIGAISLICKMIRAWLGYSHSSAGYSPASTSGLPSGVKEG